MDYITAIAFVLFIISLAWWTDWVHARSKSGDLVLLWIARAGAMALILLCAWVLNTFVWHIQSPFDGPHVEGMREKAKPIKALPTPRQEPVKGATIDEARKDHREVLREWEGT